MVTYTDLNSKLNDFECKRIDTIEDLVEFINNQKAYRPSCKIIKIGDNEISSISSDDLFGKRKHYFIYRGIKESKFHLNTSLQLHWDEIKEKKDISQLQYLRELVTLLKKNRTVQQYEQIKGNKFTDIGILALMQHYELPTPLMDWTPDIITALNFAGDGLALGKEDDEITNYASLYCINLRANYEFEESSYQNLLDKATDGLQNMIQQGVPEGTDMSNGSLNKLFGVKDLGMDQLYIDYADDAPKVIDIFGAALDLINPNSSKQNGAFIINFDEEHFLEYVWNRKTDPSYDVESEHKTVMDTIESEHGKITVPIAISKCQNPYATGYLPNTKIVCINIKKSILQEWLSNGGYVDHYDVSEESDRLKKAVKEEYNNWLNKD